MITNLAPCLVPTFFSDVASDSDSNSDDGSSSHSTDHHWRILSGKQSPGDAPRELQEAIEEDLSTRELSHSNYNYNYSSYYHNYDPWANTKKYCEWYPSSCYKYCDWYP